MSRLLWLLRFGARNLLRNRRRNLITGLALAVAFGGLLVFSGYIVWVEKFLRTDTAYLIQSGHLLIERENGLADQLTSPQKALLTAEEQAQITQILAKEPAVARVGRGLSSQMLIIRGCQSRGIIAVGRDMEIERYALNDANVLKWNAELIHPEIVANLDRLQASSPDIIGVMPTPELAMRLSQPQASDCKMPAPPPGAFQLLAKTVAGYTAAGEAQSAGEESTGIAMTDSWTMYIPLDRLQKLVETDGVGFISVFVHSPLQIPGLQRRLSAALEAVKLNVVVRPFYSDEVGLFYIGSVAFLGSIGGFFVLLVAVVAGLTLLSLFSITIAERGSEIGVLMALGFPWQKILHLFEIEAVLLTLLSLGAGFLIALVGAAGVNLARIPFQPPGTSGSMPLTIAFEPALILGIAAVFTLTSWLAVKYITRRKLQQSAVSLLQGSATL